MALLAEHKELLSSQSESKTLPEWAEYFNNVYTKREIYNFCYKKGYKIKKISKQELSKIQSNNARKWHINQDYFKTWSNNMAYILGFWFADGCIYNGKMFDITQNIKDKYILKKIANELNYEGPIQDFVDKQSARINFSCIVIYNDIISLGGKENKSLDMAFPQIPNEYLPDFIRGYFDGDGSIYNVKGKRINTTFTSGSKKFLDSLLEILRKEAKVEGGSYNPR